MKTQPSTPPPRINPSTHTAWQEQFTKATHNPKLNVQLAEQEQALYPRFAANYQHLTSLPRRARRTLERKWKRSLAGVALLMTLGQGPALAGTTISVPAGDENALIQAIIDANSELSPFDGPDTLILSNSTFTLTALNNGTYGPSGLPVIESEITIEGNGSTIERSPAIGTPEFRILAVGSSGHLTLEQTTITGGSIPDDPNSYENDNGGGIANYGGTLTLTGSTVSGNAASLYGGGVENYGGTATLTHSTVSGNTAYAGGGVENYGGALTLTHSTVSGNTAYAGGGVYNGYGGTLTLTHSTVSGNTAYAGGGVYNGYGTATLNRTLISGNTAPGGAEVYNFFGIISANNFNLFGHSGLANAQAFYNFTPGPADLTATSDGTDPTALSAILETTLADNGGLTETLALVDGSPAIDAVPKSACPPPETDQRGYTRPIDGDNSTSEECDIGAYEFDVSLLNDQVTFIPLPGTFQTTRGPGAEGCPVSFEGGAFRFEARLKNKSTSPPLGHLGVQVITLSNGNELLLDGGATGGPGATLAVPTDGGYSDEILNPNEQVTVPFTICLQNSNSFAFFVDVFGQKITP